MHFIGPQTNTQTLQHPEHSPEFTNHTDLPKSTEIQKYRNKLKWVNTSSPPKLFGLLSSFPLSKMKEVYPQRITTTMRITITQQYNAFISTLTTLYKLHLKPCPVIVSNNLFSLHIFLQRIFPIIFIGALSLFQAFLLIMLSLMSRTE